MNTCRSITLLLAAFCAQVQGREAQDEVHVVKLVKRSALACSHGQCVSRNNRFAEADSLRSFYVGEVLVGKPRSRLSVGFDTTLGQVLFRSDKCRSATCMEFRRLSAEVSATAIDLERRDVVTVGLAGEGSTAGDLVQDQVCLDTTSGRTPCTNMGIMLMTEMTEAPFRAMPHDGIIGLGLEGLSTGGPLFNFLGALSPTAPIRPQFALSLGATGGEIAFGGHNPARLARGASLAWSPVERPNEGYWQVRLQSVTVGNKTLDFCGQGTCRGIVDMTSARIGVPAALFPALEAALSLGAELAASSEGKGCPGPSLHLDLEGVTLTLGPEDYMALTEDGCKPLLKSLELPKELAGAFVLGEPVLRRYYTVFDSQNPPRIGFGLAGAVPEAEESVTLGNEFEEDAPLSFIDLELGGLPIGSTLVPTLFVIVLGFMAPFLLLSGWWDSDAVKVTKGTTTSRLSSKAIPANPSVSAFGHSSSVPSVVPAVTADEGGLARSTPLLVPRESNRYASPSLVAVHKQAAPNAVVQQPPSITGDVAEEELSGASRRGEGDPLPLRVVTQLETQLDARDAKIAELEMEKATQAELIASLRNKAACKGSVLSPAAEYDRILPLLSPPLQARAVYFLITRQWYNAWLQWVGHPCEQTSNAEASGGRVRAVRPGPIDNKDVLLEASAATMPGDGIDFVPVLPGAWDLLRSWYGGGPPIKRRAVMSPSGAVSVPFHGINLYVYRSSDIQGDAIQVIESSSTTVRELKALACEEFGFDPQKVRIWDFYTKTLFEFLEHSLDKTLGACRILDNSPLLLEEQIDEETWPYADPMQAEGVGFF